MLVCSISIVREVCVCLSICVCVCSLHMFSIRLSLWYGVGDDEVRSDLSDDNCFRWSVKLTRRRSDEIWILIRWHGFFCCCCCSAHLFAYGAHIGIETEHSKAIHCYLCNIHCAGAHFVALWLPIDAIWLPYRQPHWMEERLDIHIFFFFFLNDREKLNRLWFACILNANKNAVRKKCDQFYYGNVNNDIATVHYAIPRPGDPTNERTNERYVCEFNRHTAVYLYIDI